MERYLVTGGAGFIGSHMVERLVREKKYVRVFDNLSTGFKSHIAPFANRVDFVKGDLRNFGQVRRAMKGITRVFHAGAIRAVVRSVDDPLETDATNIRGTLHVLLAAREHKVKKVVYSSSASVYGDRKDPLFREDMIPLPVSPYAVSKLTGEHYCRLFSQLYGLPAVSLRYFNVFGPRQNPESAYSAVIPIFIYHVLKGKSPEIHWDGRQTRDFHYVETVVDANFLAMHSRVGGGEVFNVGTQRALSVLDIFNAIKKLVGRPGIKPVFGAKRPGDVRRTLADMSKTKRVLGYRVRTDFEEGLEKTVDWFLKSGVLKKIKL